VDTRISDDQSIITEEIKETHTHADGERCSVEDAQALADDSKFAIGDN